MAMHNNFYWHRLSMEDNSQGFPCVETSLAELRGRIYRIVLPRQECLVNEHGRSPWEPLRSAGVSRVVLLLIPGLNSSASVGHYHIVTSIRYTVELAQSYTWVFWHPVTSRKIYGPKVFLLTKIKSEYSNILYNRTHFPGPMMYYIGQVPQTHFPGPLVY